MSRPPRILISAGEASGDALGAGLDIRLPYGHMVVDIGGGTTDIAVISLADTVYSHTLRLGGHTMDVAIANMLRRKYDLTVGLPTAEQLKITLGHALPLTNHILCFYNLLLHICASILSELTSRLR